MEIGVERKFKKPEYTIGRMYIDSQYFCDTLEDVVRDLKDINGDGDFTDPGEGKVYGETAIPAGRYLVGIHYWLKHKKEVPAIYNVPGFTGILIHTGTNAKHTEGCLLIGQNKKPGTLENGAYFLNELTGMIRDAIEDKEDVYITIK